MQICGREFTSGLIERIQRTIQMSSDRSRSNLSREVYQWMDWRSANGKLQEVSCRKTLLELHRRKVIELPVCDKEYSFQKPSSKEKIILPEFVKTNCKLEELGKIEVFPVSSRYSKDSKIWNAMMDKYHYLGKGPLCGAQIRYLVSSEKYGVVGELSFSTSSKVFISCCMSQTFRDCVKIQNCHFACLLQAGRSGTTEKSKPNLRRIPWKRFLSRP